MNNTDPWLIHSYTPDFSSSIPGGRTIFVHTDTGIHKEIIWHEFKPTVTCYTHPDLAGTFPTYQQCLAELQAERSRQPETLYPQYKDGSYHSIDPKRHP